MILLLIAAGGIGWHGSRYSGTRASDEKTSPPGQASPSNNTDAHVASGDAPAPASSPNLPALVALARLYRLVRFYHPSEEAVAVDWDARLLAALPEVETARDAASLIEALQRFVEPLNNPPVGLRRSDQVRPPPFDPPRSGPEVAMVHNALYVALSPGDCCPTAIQKIEGAIADGLPSSWVLDLRYTAARSTGSLYSEVKVTLAWTVAGDAWSPPQRGRTHTSLAPPAPGDGIEAAIIEQPARTADGPSLLADVALAVLIDETTHPAAGGWLLGLRRSGRGVIVGRPIGARTADHYATQLTPSIEVTVPLTQYVAPDPTVDGPVMVQPDVPKTWTESIPLADLLDEMASVVPSTGRAEHRPATSKPVSKLQALPPNAPNERTARLADVIVTDVLLHDFAPSWRSPATDSNKALIRALSAAAKPNATCGAALAALTGASPDLEIVVAPHDKRRPAPRSTLRNGVEYVDLTRTSATQISAIAKAAATASAVIVDLRGPVPTGAQYLLGHLTERPIEHPVGRFPVRNNPDDDRNDDEPREVTWRIQPASPRIIPPAVFLVDDTTAGSAAAIAEAVSRHQLGQLCGQTTAGISRTSARLPSGRVLIWPNGAQSISAGGLDFRCTVPDIPATAHQELETALDHIKKTSAPK
ncbi:MAG: hypothetical protein GY778_20510 [bacterium]|nr:hypothetical protein [bacterium]